MLIDPERLPQENTTSQIVTNLFDSDELDFDNYTVLGVIRGSESPNA